MNSRFKLVAALGLALATGFAGVASAQTGTPESMPSQNVQTAPTAITPARTAIKAPTRKLSMKKAAIKGHRTHVSHRTMRHRMVAHGVSTHAKVAHKVTKKSGAMTAKSGLLRKHVAKAKSLYTRHAMKSAAKPTIIR